MTPLNGPALEKATRAIAEILDHPSVFMGGPSHQNMAKAKSILEYLQGSALSGVELPGWRPGVDWSQYSPQETQPGPLRNLYEPHHMMIDSGTFWRCSHGETGYYACPACGRKHPEKFLAHLEETTVRPAPPPPVTGDAP